MILNKVVGVDLNEKLSFEQRLEGREIHSYPQGFHRTESYVRSFNNLTAVCSENKIIEVHGNDLVEQNLVLFSII